MVILSAEDGLEDTIRPRLDAAGADVNRISALTGVAYRVAGENDPREAGVDLTRHLPALEAAIKQTPDCKLVIVDPVTAFMGDTDSHKNAEVRALLARLAELAARCYVAVLAVTHLNKASTLPALYRAMGSLAFVAAARAVWAVVKDKHDPSGRRRLFLPLKNNLGDDQSGLAYSLTARFGGEGTIVAWEPDPVTIKADDAMAHESGRRGPDPAERDEAGDYLREALATGPRLARELIEEAREAHGVAKRTLDRAKVDVGVKSYQEPKLGPWWWKLTDSKIATFPDSKQLGNLGNLAENPKETDVFGADDSNIAKLPVPGALGENGHDPDAINRLLDGAAAEDEGERW